MSRTLRVSPGISVARDEAYGECSQCTSVPWMRRGPSSPDLLDLAEACEQGLLIDDPNDLSAFGAAVGCLLHQSEFATQLGHNARAKAAAEFLGDRHLEQWCELLRTLG